jgi:hypothetical protein
MIEKISVGFMYLVIIAGWFVMAMFPAMVVTSWFYPMENALKVGLMVGSLSAMVKARECLFRNTKGYKSIRKTIGHGVIAWFKEFVAP